MAANEVRVVYRKYDGALHWQQTMRRLGVDEHGRWLGAPVGTAARKGDDPPLLLTHPQLMLIPRDAWWTAVFYGPPADCEIYCDITTPPTWPHPGEVTMVDLDLDVCRNRTDRKVSLLDEDEFAEHRIRYGYPDDVVAAAWRAAKWLRAALANGTQPFSGEYQTWFSAIA